MGSIEIKLYKSDDGKIPFNDWPYSLKDRTTIARIHARLARVENGNYGDTRPVDFGVHESTQNRDIKKAHDYWSDYLRRNDEK